MLPECFSREIEEVYKCIPGGFRSEAHAVVRNQGVDASLHDGRRDAEDHAGQGERPSRVEQQVPLLVEHRQAEDGHGQLRIAIEHDDQDSEEQRAQVRRPLGFCFVPHRCAEECRHGNQGDDPYLLHSI